MTAYESLIAVREGRAFSVKMPESEVMRRHSAAMLLVIDQFHQIDGNNRDSVAIRVMLQTRRDNHRCTVIVSNEKPGRFAERLGASLADRLRLHRDLIECSWPSLRTSIE